MRKEQIFHGELAELWNKIGLIALTFFFPFMFYIRGGSFFLSENASEAMQITAGGWGACGFSLCLIIMSALGIVYIKRLDRQGIRSFVPWPACTTLEKKARDPLISIISLFFYTVIPIIGVYSGAYRYAESNVALWNESIPLDTDFFLSRLKAYSVGCNDQPCFRIHPIDGHEYILYVTDSIIVILVLLAFTLFFLWGSLVYRYLKSKNNLNFFD